MILISGFIFFLLLSIDMATKTFATTLNKTIEVIPGFFSFTYTENFGAAWGVGEGKNWLFICVAIVVCIALLLLLLTANTKKKLPFIIIPVIMAGAMGNCIDRIFNGYVVDFLDFNILGYDFPVFNFADICICIGAVILLIAIISDSNDELFFKKNFFLKKGGNNK